MSFWGAIADAANGGTSSQGIQNLPYSPTNQYDPSLNVDPIMRDYDNSHNGAQEGGGWNFDPSQYAGSAKYPTAEAVQAHINEVLSNRATAEANGGYVDPYGRLFNKGATIQGDGGYYTYTGEKPALDENGYLAVGGTLANPTGGGRPTGMDLAAPGWQWTDTGPTPASDGQKQNTLINAGLMNEGPDRGSGMGAGLSTWVKAFGPAAASWYIGATGGYGPSVPFGNGTITMAEAVAEGATAADLAEMGFQASAIAASGAPGAVSAAGAAADSVAGAGGPGSNPAIDPYAIDQANAGSGALTTGYDAAGGVAGNLPLSPVVPDFADTPAGAAGGSGNLASLGAGGAIAGGVAPWVNPALAAGSLGTALAGGVLGANAASDAAHNAADATTAAANTAAQATLTGQREAIAAQQKMYDQQRADFAPFRDVAPRSLATLQSAVYGGPQDYTDPTGAKQTANAQQFDLAGLSNSQTDALKNFNPTATEAYKWQLGQGQNALAKSLTMQGRGSGSVATNAMTKFGGDLASSEYDKGYQRLSSLNDLNYNRMSAQKQDYQNQLLNLIKTAQGAAGTTSAAGQNFANASSTASNTAGTNLANIATNQGTNLANANLVQGQSQANLYSGLTQLPFQAANTAIQGGWKPFA